MSIQELQISYTSRPEVSLGGREDGAFAQDIVAFSAEEDTEGLGRCEIRLTCQPDPQGRYPYLEPGRLRLGTSLAVTVGRTKHRRQVFDGTVSAVQAVFGRDGGVQIVVLAEDALQGLRLKRRSRVFENSTDAEIATTIASEHGLTAEVDGGKTSHPVLAQLGCSDLAFLRERAHAAGADLWLEGSTLHMSARSGDPAVSLAYGAELMDLTLRADVAGQSSNVGVTGWDVEGKVAFKETGQASDVPGPESNGTLGSTALERAFGTRDERVLTSVPFTQGSARALAKSTFLRQVRRFVTGTGTADGDPRIRVGSRVELREVGRLFTGTYAVTRAAHVYDSQNGYLTRFDVERAVVSS